MNVYFSWENKNNTFSLEDIYEKVLHSTKPLFEDIEGEKNL